MRAISVAFLAGLIGLAPHVASAADAPPDSASLAVDAGRLMVMVDQSEDALKMLAPTVKAEDTGPEPQGDHAFSELVSSVLRYNIIAHEACRARVVDPELCGESYRPVWLTEAPDAARSDAVLRAMIDDATAHLEPFWSDICAKAKHATKDEAFCQLE
ncbi:MAG: hypothetical protein ABSC92_08770 [Rhizomicrobium sp.]|jgi:hypothetical protein